MSDTDTLSTERSADPAGAPDAGQAADSAAAPARRRGGLTGMVLADLRQLAGQLNIPDTAGMRKGDLISAIKQAQASGGATGGSTRPSRQLSLGEDVPTAPAASPAPAATNGAATATDAPSAPATPAAAESASSGDGATTRTRRRRTASRPAGSPDAGGAEAGGLEPAADTAAAPAATRPATSSDAGAPVQESGTGRADTYRAEAGRGDTDRGDTDRGDAGSGRDQVDRREQGDRDSGGRDSGGRDSGGRDNGGRNRADTGNREGRDTGNREGGSRPQNNRDGGGGNNRQQQNQNNQQNQNQNQNNQQQNQNRPNNRDDDDDDDSGRGRRGRRFRDRNRRGRDRRDGDGGQGGNGNGNGDVEVRDDDVLVPVAGILDVLDNYAFVRTTGYLSGPDDVYVSLSMVRRHGLRRGDAVTGVVRQPREGEQQRQKFNPLVRVDTINDLEPDKARNRPEFTKLTPLYPNERLRLETDSHKLTTRVIDLVMPVGKGQRALIVSPPKAGKTTIMQNIANAITTNNPECHLMVVLVDERPEEVTDMQRSVKGEVIASTFDRPPTDHTTVAELSIERAKRLVEAGMDVVVLLDNITRLGRAYNLAAPASGRILSGGVDSTALYPPKRFLGAARNIEDGGSLTIFATALVETGSTMDTVIFEEFKGTGNAELKLDRRIADKRVFPAIDVGDSGTRKEELLMSPDEHAVVVKLRRVLAGLDDQQAIDLLLTQLRKTRTNIEFLMQVAKNTPGQNERD